MLKVCTMFPITWWIHSSIALKVGFSEVLGLSDIPYSVSISYFLNSLPIHFDLWSYMISVVIGYLDSHAVSTKFSVDIALLLLYCVILNHPVTGYIILTAFRYKFYFYTFILMTYGQFRFTQSLSMVFPQIILLVIYHLLYLIVFYVGKCHN